jgi:hypothetical protein
MSYKTFILLLSFIPVIFIGCEGKWDDHYDDYPETVNANLWDEMQKDSRISKFCEILKENQYDTLFQSDIPYTLYVPSNGILEDYISVNSVTPNFLGYLITPHFIQSGNIYGARVVQTLIEKYIRFERYGAQVLIDGKSVSFESPLFLNGKYFILDEIIEPQPNLYEYFKRTNPVLSDYIDSRDSIILDKELSKPIGFDSLGNTVYDTVSDVINNFERKYFEVKHEFRENSATIVFPKSEDYINALNEVANDLGGNIVDYRDVPLKWQQDVLMPFLFKKGIFLNRIEPEEFMWKTETDTTKLLNILGDSVVIDYIPTEKAVCSNGYAYNYKDFVIPDSLYKGKSRKEAETLLMETGINRYRWRDDVIVESDIAVQPKRVYLSTASEDSLLSVDFPKGYSGRYSVQFKGPNLFPGKYLMTVETHMDYGGLWNIYVNDELVKSFNYYEFYRMNGVIYSVTGKRYFPRGRYNMFDMYVENITSYEEVDIRFEYKGPGTFVPYNGLLIDYIEFEPVEN